MPDPARTPFDSDVLRRPNAAPQEDVAEERPDALGWLDHEISESFPASDPLSHWAGPALEQVPL